MRKRELLRSLFPMDQRGVLLMDKTWRSRVFGQGRTRSGGPRFCADRSGAKNSTPFCGGGGYTADWTLKRRYGKMKYIRDENDRKIER